MGADGTVGAVSQAGSEAIARRTPAAARRLGRAAGDACAEPWVMIAFAFGAAGCRNVGVEEAIDENDLHKRTLAG